VSLPAGFGVGPRPGRITRKRVTLPPVAGVGTLFIALGLGAAVIPSPPFTAHTWRGLARLSPTHAVLVPAMIERLVEEQALSLPSLRVLVYGSSPIRPDTVRRALEALPGVDIFSMYGQTEGSPLTFPSAEEYRHAVAGGEDLLLTVGRAFEPVELGVEQAAGAQAGELCARAEHLFRTDADGWMRTGDVAGRGPPVVATGRSGWPSPSGDRSGGMPGVRLVWRPVS